MNRLLVFGHELRRARNYWLDVTEGIEGRCRLPLEPYVSPGERDSMTVVAPREVHKQLTALTRNAPLLDFTALASAAGIVLRRYSVEGPSVFLMPDALESTREGGPNDLLLRLDVDLETTFKPLLIGTRDRINLAFKNATYPFDRLLKDRGWPQCADHAAEVGLALEGLHAPHARPDALPLNIRFTCDYTTLSAHVDFEPGRISNLLARQFVEGLYRLLGEASQCLNRPVADFDLLGEEEIAEAMAAATGAPVPDDTPHVLDQLAATATRWPSRTALLDPSRQWTFAELAETTDLMSARLRDTGAAPNAVVALLCPRSASALLAAIATWKTGAAFVPIDLDYPLERRWAMLDEIRPTIVICDEQIEPWKSDNAPFAWIRIGELMASTANLSEPTPQERSPGDAAYMIFTSGTTGHPKAAAVSHGALSVLAHGIGELIGRTALDDGLVAGLNAPLSFDPSVQQICLMAAGASLVLIPDAERRDSARLLTFLSRHAVDVLDITPSHLSKLVEAGFPTDTYSHPNLLLVGGEKLPSDLLGILANAAKGGLRSFNLYGPTECAVDAVALPVTGLQDRDRIGRPLPGRLAVVLDDHMNLQPTGAVGELWLGGAIDMLGYHLRPAETADRFRPNPFATQPGARLYRTGDTVRRHSDGQLEFLGRNDDQVKVRGHRIELEEIANVTLDLPGVRSAVAIKIGEGPQANLALYISPRIGSKLTISTLRKGLQATLPTYAVPNHIILVDALPLTPNGKIDRRALPPLEGTRPDLDVPYEPPANEIELEIAETIGQSLNVDRVGRNDDFFELGGQSLQAVQVLTTLKRQFSVDLPLNAFYIQPTVAQLAEKLGSSPCVAEVKTNPASTSQASARPVTSIEGNIWFQSQAEPDSRIYNGGLLVTLSGDLSIESFKAAFIETTRRHPAVRTRLVHSDGVLTREIVNADDWDCDFLDFTAEQNSEKVARDKLSAFIGRAYDLRTGPLMRAALCRIGRHRHLLAIGMHHIVGDALSSGTLMRTVSEAYGAHVAGRSLDDHPPADEAHDGVTANLAFWADRLTGMPSLLPWPATPDATTPSWHGGRTQLHVDPVRVSELTEQARRLHITRFALFFSAFAMTIREICQSDRLLIGTAHHGRSDTTIVDVGAFATVVPVRVHFEGNSDGRNVVRQVHQELIEIADHAACPPADIATEVHATRSTDRLPLIQAVCVLDETPYDALVLSGLTVSVERFDPPGAKFELAMTVRFALDGSACCTFDYAHRWFDDSQIADLMQRFESNLLALGTEPATRQSPAGRIDFFSNLGPAVFASRDPATYAADWAESHRSEVTAAFEERGGVLFSGFAIDEPQKFLDLVHLLSHEILDDADRPEIEGGEGGEVYEASSLDYFPPERNIPLHNENSFAHNWPRKIWFWCAQAAGSGGETLLAPSDRVYDAIDPNVRTLFETKGVRTIRNYYSREWWARRFGLTSEAEVEAYCAPFGIKCEWLDGERLRTHLSTDAVLPDPTTGRNLWFNQAHLWHKINLSPEMSAAFGSNPRPIDLPNNAMFADGTPIEDDHIHEIIRAYANVGLKLALRTGDVLMLDNMRFAHGRAAFKGERRIGVTMTDLYDPKGLNTLGRIR